MKYVITGIVHPERAAIHLEPVKLALGDGRSATLSCDASQICVVLNDDTVDGYITALVRAEQHAEMVVSSLGFSLGCGYLVEMIQVVEENGTTHVFGVHAAGARFDPYEPILKRALEQSGRDFFFRLAVRDYVRAISNVTDCATYCYRAIEAIKSAFQQPDRDDGEGWAEMHRILGTDREAIIKVVKDYADPIRHGNAIEARPTTSAIRLEMVSLTRDILTRYLNYAAPVAGEVAR